MPMQYCTNCGTRLTSNRPAPDFREAIAKQMPRPKRKLSAWNKFVKANSKKPRFRLRSGSPNLKKLGVAFRKTPAGKKSRK